LNRSSQRSQFLQQQQKEDQEDEKSEKEEKDEIQTYPSYYCYLTLSPSLISTSSVLMMGLFVFEHLDETDHEMVDHETDYEIFDRSNHKIFQSFLLSLFSFISLSLLFILEKKKVG